MDVLLTYKTFRILGCSLRFTLPVISPERTFQLDKSLETVLMSLSKSPLKINLPPFIYRCLINYLDFGGTLGSGWVRSNSGYPLLSELSYFLVYL